MTAKDKALGVALASPIVIFICLNIAAIGAALFIILCFMIIKALYIRKD